MHSINSFGSTLIDTLEYICDASIGFVLYNYILPIDSSFLGMLFAAWNPSTYNLNSISNVQSSNICNILPATYGNSRAYPVEHTYCKYYCSGKHLDRIIRNFD